MSAEAPETLVVAIGDIHGRFRRVDDWLRALEDALRQRADLVLAVGDVEAFASVEDHRRKAAKRAMPAEFAEYAAAAQTLHRPLHFIGGNNEDFASLHSIARGGAIGADAHYLGRAGVAKLAGLEIAYLSGIHAPRFIDAPLKPIRSLETAKQAGYFRAGEVARLESVRRADVMLVHEWPRGLVASARGATRRLRAQRFPWIGNAVTRRLVDRIRPTWLLCGHSHVALATRLAHLDGGETRVACLDQAARPDGAVFWMKWRDGSAESAGWGISGTAAWRAGDRWDVAMTPRVGEDDGDNE